MTVMTIEDRVRSLSPIQQVTVSQAIVSRLFADESVRSAAADSLDPSVGQSEEFAALAAEAAADPTVELGPEESGRIAEIFLVAAARDPGLAPLLEAELDAFKDEKQFVETALAIGLAVSMVIVAATTRLEYRKGGFVGVKEPASPELVEAAAKIVTGLVSSVKP